MSFLKKAAQVALQIGKFVIGFGPLIAQVDPAAAPVISEITQIVGVIGSVEMIGQTLTLSGADKLKAAAPLVSQVILASPFMQNHKIEDPIKFQAAIGTITGGVVDLLNSLKDSGVSSTDKT